MQWLLLLCDGVLSRLDQKTFHLTVGALVAGDGDLGAFVGTEICDEPHSREGVGGRQCGCRHLFVAS